MRELAVGFILASVFIHTTKICEIWVFRYVFIHFGRSPMLADLCPNAIWTASRQNAENPSAMDPPFSTREPPFLALEPHSSECKHGYSDFILHFYTDLTMIFMKLSVPCAVFRCHFLSIRVTLASKSCSGYVDCSDSILYVWKKNCNFPMVLLYFVWWSDKRLFQSRLQ